MRKAPIHAPRGDRSNLVVGAFWALECRGTQEVSFSSEVENLAVRRGLREFFRMPGIFDIAKGDAVSWLRSMPARTAHLIITDAPYESLEKHRAVGTTTRLKHSKSSSNDWFTIFPNARFAEFFAAAYRALEKNAHLYFFCDQETMFVAKPIAEASGFKFWKPIIWDKRQIGMGYHYRARYECILFFEKGKRRLANLGIPDIIEAPRVRNGYPTEKPVAVGDVLIKQSSSPGELVVDPFMGSGAFGEAALTNDRNFAGNDLGDEALRIAEMRLRRNGVTGQLLLPSSSETWARSPKLRKINRGEAA